MEEVKATQKLVTVRRCSHSSKILMPAFYLVFIFSLKIIFKCDKFSGFSQSFWYKPPSSIMEPQKCITFFYSFAKELLSKCKPDRCTLFPNYKLYLHVGYKKRKNLNLKGTGMI